MIQYNIIQYNTCFTFLLYPPSHLTPKDRIGCILQGHICAEGSLMIQTFCGKIMVQSWERTFISFCSQRGQAPDLQNSAPIAVSIHICTSDRVSNVHSQQRRKSALAHTENVLKKLSKAFVMEQNTVERQSFIQISFVHENRYVLSSPYLTRKCVSNYCPKVFSSQSCLVSYM